jgi:hypothetical protein
VEPRNNQLQANFKFICRGFQTWRKAKGWSVRSLWRHRSASAQCPLTSPLFEYFKMAMPWPGDFSYDPKKTVYAPDERFDTVREYQVNAFWQHFPALTDAPVIVDGCPNRP